MKTTCRLLVWMFALAVAGAVNAGAASATAGPKGGRMLEAGYANVEFHVTAERIAEVLFYGPDRQPIGPGSATVAVTAEAPLGRVVLEMVAMESGFASKDPLPAGEPYRIVVQLREAADAKPANFRINLILSTCGECSHAEYACVCEGH